MGFWGSCFKVVGCIGAGVVAVAAAPVVLSAAAVAGTAAMGAAASAGAAVAGGAAAAAGSVAAAGSAAVGAVTGAGAAVSAAAGAGITAAGSAATGAITTVATTVFEASAIGEALAVGAAETVAGEIGVSAVTSVTGLINATALEVGAMAGAVAETSAGTVMSASAASAVGDSVGLSAAALVVGEGNRRAIKPAVNLGKSLVDNVIKKKVTPVPGCIVHCDLAFGNAEHSGVYAYGEIIEVDGSGKIQAVSPDQFINKSVVRTAISIYIACDKDGDVLSNPSIAARAEKMQHKKRNYNLILDNCHQFTSGCITGDFENADNFFWMLEGTIKERLNDGKSIQWLVWDRD